MDLGAFVEGLEAVAVCCFAFMLPTVLVASAFI